eukprot:1155229-Pelagomonas_calceolata.AAC.5
MQYAGYKICGDGAHPAVPLTRTCKDRFCHPWKLDISQNLSCSVFARLSLPTFLDVQQARSLTIMNLASSPRVVVQHNLNLRVGTANVFACTSSECRQSVLISVKTELSRDMIKHL